VPFFWPNFVGIFPEIYTLYMVGISNQSVPEMAIDHGMAQNGHVCQRPTVDMAKRLDFLRHIDYLGWAYHVIIENEN
jgi:hypothetical protein